MGNISQTSECSTQSQKHTFSPSPPHAWPLAIRTEVPTPSITHSSQPRNNTMRKLWNVLFGSLVEGIEGIKPIASNLTQGTIGLSAAYKNIGNAADSVTQELITQEEV